MKPLEKRRKKTRRERRLEKRRLERSSGDKEEKKMSGDDEGKIQKDKERERPSDAKIELDGGEGEGGGQILRIAFASAFLTKQAISIRSIRKNRSTPGFRAQHLAVRRFYRKKRSPTSTHYFKTTGTLEWNGGYGLRFQHLSFESDIYSCHVHETWK